MKGEKCMPAIRINTNIELTNDISTSIMQKLGQLIEIIPGKTEERLMIQIIDKQTMFFQGNDNPCMFIEVDLYKSVENHAKDKFVQAVSLYFQEKQIIEPQQVYTSFREHQNWGTNGVLK